MGCRIVEMSQDPRKEQFAYFRSLANPYVGVTVELDVTELAAWSGQTGTSFFLAVLYAAVRAANSVPELRHRSGTGGTNRVKTAAYVGNRWSAPG